MLIFFVTPFPLKRFKSPSLSSIASCIPVEAPDGTEAAPFTPLSNSISVNKVGNPQYLVFQKIVY